MVIRYNEFGLMGIILCFEIFGVMIIRHTGIRCNEMIPRRRPVVGSRTCQGYHCIYSLARSTFSH